MDEETLDAIQQLAKKALQNQAHILTILRLLAIKKVITTKEFDVMYNETLKELKDDAMRSLLNKHDRELTSLARNLGKI